MHTILLRSFLDSPFCLITDDIMCYKPAWKQLKIKKIEFEVLHYEWQEEFFFRAYIYEYVSLGLLKA